MKRIFAVIFSFTLAGCWLSQTQQASPHSETEQSSSITYYEVPNGWSPVIHPTLPLVLRLPAESTMQSGRYHGIENVVNIIISNTFIDGKNMGYLSFMIQQTPNEYSKAADYFPSICSNGVTLTETNPLQKKILIKQETDTPYGSITRFQDWCNDLPTDSQGFPVFSYDRYLIIVNGKSYLALSSFESIDDENDKENQLLRMVIYNIRPRE